MKRYIAAENDDGVRLSRFVEKVTQNMPKSLLYKGFRSGRIKVNGKAQKADYRIGRGDEIELYIVDEFFAAQTQANGGAQQAYTNGGATQQVHANGGATQQAYSNGGNYGTQLNTLHNNLAAPHKAANSGGGAPQAPAKANGDSAAPKATSSNNVALQAQTNAAGAEFTLNIAYEDDNLLIAAKPAGMLCHSDKTGDTALIDFIIAHLERSGSYDARRENTFRPALCNRIDRGTEGLVIAAKNYKALAAANELIKNGCVEKHYLCITHGNLLNGTYEALHSEDAAEDNKVLVREKSAAQSESGGEKTIITSFKTVDTKGFYSLVDVNLITGRKHQIRAHVACLGAHILGDTKYGSAKQNALFGLKTQMLCANKIIFNIADESSPLHYLNGKTVEYENPSPLAYFNTMF